MSGNFAAGMKNTLTKATGGILRPRWLWFGVTDNCNSRCSMCNIWQQPVTKEPLTPREIETTLKDPVFQGIEYIINSGGETTLRADLKEVMLAEFSALPGATIQLSTNGLLPERMLDAVKFGIERGMKLSVGTSLDGIGPAHDAVRGVPGNFQKVDYLLTELKKLRAGYPGLDIGFGFTLMDTTLANLEATRDYARKMDVGFLMQWFNQSPFYSNAGDVKLDREKMLEAVKSYPDPILRDMWLDWLHGKSIRFNCFALHSFCVLKCNGDISPCLSKWDVCAGNVRENTPSEIWQSEAARQARRGVRACEGCLNSWGTDWSFRTSGYPYLTHLLTHPASTARRIVAKLGRICGCAK
ncbi:MAG: radical SAM protein [Elusimicrobiaceae bacterium]|nr:radical SAM protein [Elusimicrobiaceae bacterium]